MPKSFDAIFIEFIKLQGTHELHQFVKRLRVHDYCSFASCAYIGYKMFRFGLTQNGEVSFKGERI